MNKFVAIYYDGDRHLAKLVEVVAVGAGPLVTPREDLGLTGDVDVVALIEAPNGIHTMVIIDDQKQELHV